MLMRSAGEERTTRPAAMADVALRAGVSIQTVSRVIHGHRRVAPVTRQRVEQAIAELAYRPNAAAQALASRAGLGQEMSMGRTPTGRQFRLSAGSAEAVVTEIGGGLRSLRMDGRDLVAGFAADQLRPVYRGAVLAPWPNRVGAGWYAWDGHEHRLPLTEPDRGNALHGLLCWTPWLPTAQHDDLLSLTAKVWPQAGYPFEIDLTVTYQLETTGLIWRLDAYNSGAEAAPYGCSVHPYLVAGPGQVDDWSLAVPADEVLEVDRARLLPLALRQVEGTSFDFRSPQPLAGARIDHAYTRVRPDADGLARVAVRSTDGTGVAMEWDPHDLPWVQIHTADRPEPELNRVGLAVEPMTCPPNAFQTGDDVIRLEPGQTHSSWWRIRAL
jgi:aldose 1-epimerase